MSDDVNGAAAALDPEHYKHLHDGSGIADEVIVERGYRTIRGRKALVDLGFAASQYRRLGGLILPVWAPGGSNGLYVFRPDDPAIDVDGKTRKYVLPKHAGVRLDVPPRCRPGLDDPTIPLWLTEGQKKADALASHGLTAAALLGVWNFLGRDKTGSVKLLADFDYIAWAGRTVNVVFDSDVMTKPAVRQALDRLTEHLQRKGAAINAVYLPGQTDGSKCGVDDYLLSHSVDELQALVSQPRPEPKAAAPMVELLDEAPPTLSRPLALIGDHAYAAAWLWTRTTTTEIVDRKTGDVIRLSEPAVQTERRLFVVRDDGVVFGEGGDHPMEEIGLDVKIAIAPPDVKTWSSVGVKRYRTGQRPDPRGIFGRLVRVVDRFMSFNHSLGDQRVMCEFIGCYILTTWTLDAFEVAGYLWPWGGFGCAKSKLAKLIVSLSYLGESVVLGTSYAWLREAADMGATILLDDAEVLSDPKQSDPDIRGLFLSGNTRGSYAGLMQPKPDGRGWEPRQVNTYGARLFTSTNTPDGILGSRCIVVPLIRTGDAYRANASPTDSTVWPENRRALLDDLWGLALANIARMAEQAAAVAAEAPLAGRNLEPWLAVLSVARWLDSLGEAGLYQRITTLARNYQTKRTDLEVVDLKRLLLLALSDLVQGGTLGTSGTFGTFACAGVEYTIQTSQVGAAIDKRARDMEIIDDTVSFAGEKAIGQAIKRLRRFRRSTHHGSARSWIISAGDLDDLLRSEGLEGLPAQSENGDVSDGETPTTDVNVPNVPNGPNVPNADAADSDNEVLSI